jgi:hypothetical protein
VHVAFRDWIVERECTPLAFDYYLDESNVMMSEPGTARI